MSIVDLGNGGVLKNGVVFIPTIRYRTKILKDEQGKVIGSEYTHCKGPLYPEMDDKDHAEEENMQDTDTAQEMNTEDLMEYFRDCDRLEEIAQC